MTLLYKIKRLIKKIRSIFIIWNDTHKWHYINLKYVRADIKPWADNEEDAVVYNINIRLPRFVGAQPTPYIRYRIAWEPVDKKDLPAWLKKNL